jgi:hypothetical protein
VLAKFCAMKCIGTNCTGIKWIGPWFGDAEVRMRLELRRAVVVVLSAVAFWGASSLAALDQPACPAIDTVSVAARQRLQVYVDPATGRFRAPTPEELRKGAEKRREAKAAALAELSVKTHPDGMKSVDLRRAFMMDVVVDRLPDGTVQMRCVPDPRQGSPAGRGL